MVKNKEVSMAKAKSNNNSTTEKLEVLKVLMDVNGDEQGIIDFIDYYGFDVGELDEQIQERYEWAR